MHSEACAAFILSQKAEGWKELPDAYDDGGYSGGNTDRPGLAHLMLDIAAGRIKIVVVYKVDRLTRSLSDFAKLVEQFDARGVSFVSVTQQFSTTSSMGRLTLNVLLSFAQFERELTGERIRDKIAASKKRGLWMGGNVPVGYRSYERTLVIDEHQAERIRDIYRIYLNLGCVQKLKTELDSRGWVTPLRKTRCANAAGERPYSRGHLYRILGNPIYRGMISHKGELHLGQHPAIIDPELWEQVQILLISNRQGHRGRVNGKSSSMLAGCVFDADGERLTSTHTCKGSKRYRYYVTSSLMGNGKSNDPNRKTSGLRIPASELERAVRLSLVNYLGDSHRLLVDLEQPEAGIYLAVTRRVKQMSDTLMHGAPSEQFTLLKLLIERVTVSQNEIEVILKRSAFASELGEGNPIKLTMPVSFRRCGFGIRVIIPSQKSGGTGIVDARLVKLVRRGIGWFRRMVMEREPPSVIAKAEGVSASLVQRIIFVAFLAPDIVAAIEEGRQPVTLTSNSLLKVLPLPACWIEQRRLLGVEPTTY